MQRGCINTVYADRNASRAAASSWRTADPACPAGRIAPPCSRRAATSEIHSIKPPLRFHLFSANGQTADPLSRRGEDRIAHSRSDRRHTWFAHPAHLLVAGNDVHFHQRHLVHSQHLIIVKWRVWSAAVLKRDLSVRRSR